METLVLKVDPEAPDPDVIRRAAEVIRGGGLVAFPTETVYGLAADAFNADAVSRIYEAKGRPSCKPLPVQIASDQDIRQLVVEIPPVAAALMKRFWPGPLTLVFRAAPVLLPEVTADTGKVGIRIPDHYVGLELLRALGRPIVAPSANVSEHPAPTTGEQVSDYLRGRIELILDAGPSPLQIASTVVDVTQSPPRVLRVGVITPDVLSGCILADDP